MDRKMPWLIVKFGQEKHLKEIRQGKLFMNSWQYFSDCESHLERRDENEGVAYLIQPGISEIKINDHKLSKEGGFLRGSESYLEDGIRTKIFCASIIFRKEEVREDWKIFDDRVKDFGDSFLVIWNLKVFFTRLTASLNKLKSGGTLETFEYKPVTYYDENSYDGEVGPFMKSLKYAHQKEWRLLIRNKAMCSAPFTLKIESLEDISYIGKTGDLKNRIKPKPNGDGFILEFS